MVEQDLEFDRSLLGQQFPAGSFEVTETMIRDYAVAVGETDPIHSDEAEAKRQGFRGLVAPPTIVNLLIRGFGRPKVNLSYTGLGAHAGQSLQPLAPICAGDRLEASTLLKDVYTKTGRTGTMAFVVWETGFTNQDGVVVARAQESFMTRKA
jgi:acyl dehydratase